MFDRDNLVVMEGSGANLLHGLLLQHARARADQLAIIAAAGTWTYRELVDATGANVERLREAGLRPGDRVVCELAPSRGAAALLCALSICGLVYVPVSPETPRARITEIIAISEPRLVVRASRHDARDGVVAGWLSADRLELAGVIERAERGRDVRVLDSDLAYIIFTSGTTGRPKGIMMTHGAAVTFLRALVAHCRLEAHDRVGSVAPLSFDFSLLDLATALGSGATLVLVPPLLPHQPRAFVDFLLQREVTHMSGVPSIWRATLAHGADELPRLAGHLHNILYAGEAFSVADVRLLQSALPSLRLINCFGHSESIACSFRDLENPLEPEHTRVPFAQAHTGVEMWLLDEQQRPISRPGVVGEIYLRGPSLFSGYWRDPDATAAALVVDPLRPHSPTRVFRSGDLASWTKDGELYFVGRRDLQVKIGGNRVEIDEIERCLAQHPAIGGACVGKVGEGLDAKLVAFLLVTPAATDTVIGELRSICAQTLPRYMMPSWFLPVSELPLTINGKVDRNRLVESFTTRA